ncbi:MAG: phenylalanine--tRNA ligase beta subunit-related protein [Acidobacteria bacterium]|jgi:DNA/RNA-binding domain of Phe-tRNA-synthetase-like protein|nr:phenylalanine--tRNA ligase beta subunit-related protein [Acidobacteriota bacterium]
MKELTYAIAAEVFTAFPEYRRGVVVAHGVRNGDSPSELVELLRAEEALARERLGVETLTAEPRLASWREAFRWLGYKPGDFRPSIEALLRRVLRGQELPAISTLVDIGTVISLRHLLPVGGHAIDVLAGDIALRPATGAEEFVAFGSDGIERPAPGEFIFTEGQKVLTRRWIWRQAKHTLTLPGTGAIEFNIDGLPPVADAQVRAAGHDLMDLVARFCGGRTRFEILDRQHPLLRLDRSVL